MVLFVTSSPYVNDADRAILSNDNAFIDRIREVLPPNPRALFIAADPENRDDTCHFGADTVGAFSEAGMGEIIGQVNGQRVKARSHFGGTFLNPNAGRFCFSEAQAVASYLNLKRIAHRGEFGESHYLAGNEPHLKQVLAKGANLGTTGFWAFLGVRCPDGKNCG